MRRRDTGRGRCLEETRTPTPAFPLWCKSNYSFLEGASQSEELIEAAERLGLPGLALRRSSQVS